MTKKTFKRRLNEGYTEICFLKQREAANMLLEGHVKKEISQQKYFGLVAIKVKAERV